MELSKDDMWKVDYLVAKLVMGYPFHDDDEIAAALKRDDPSPDDDSQKHLLTAKDAKQLQRPPPFCREKTLALSVVERLIEDGLTCDLSRSKVGWAVKFLDDSGRVLGQAHSEHLGTTICLAALRSIGVKV